MRRSEINTDVTNRPKTKTPLPKFKSIQRGKFEFEMSNIQVEKHSDFILTENIGIFKVFANCANYSAKKYISDNSLLKIS